MVRFSSPPQGPSIDASLGEPAGIDPQPSNAIGETGCRGTPTGLPKAPECAVYSMHGQLTYGDACLHLSMAAHAPSTIVLSLDSYAKTAYSHVASGPHLTCCSGTAGVCIIPMAPILVSSILAPTYQWLPVSLFPRHLWTALIQGRSFTALRLVLDAIRPAASGLTTATP